MVQLHLRDETEANVIDVKVAHQRRRQTQEPHECASRRKPVLRGASLSSAGAQPDVLRPEALHFLRAQTDGLE